MANNSGSEFNPSACEVISAIVTSHGGNNTQQIAGVISQFEINQSMNTMSYSGNLTVLDTIGLLEGFPMRSEETIDLKLMAYDLNTEVNLKVQVYRIDNITASESSNSVMYKMHFVSKISYEASKRSITKSYQSSVSGIAKQIFNTYFAKLGSTDYLDQNVRSRTLAYATSRSPIISEPDRNFYIQPTANITNCVIPSFIPTEAMQFLSSQAYQPETPSNSFKFFETLENFYFATDEYFIQTAQLRDLVELFYAPASSIDPMRPQDQINRVEGIQIISKGIDTASDIFSGSYRNDVMEIDLIRRKLVKTSFDFSKPNDARYIDMSGNPRDLADNPHTPEFREATFTDENAKQFIVFKDYQQNGDIPSSLHTDRFMPQIISNRLSYSAHLNATSLSCKMKGRLDLRPGMVANMNIQNLDGVDELSRNRSLSGRYLIQSTLHSRDDSGSLNTVLRLVKFDWSRGKVDV